MRNNYILLGIFIILLIGLVQANDIAFTLRQSETSNVTFHVLNSDNSPATASASCEFTAKDPNQITIINHENMTFKGDGDFTLEINGTKLINIGPYDFTLDCYDGSSLYLSTSSRFKVTPSGTETLETGESNTIIIGIIIMLIISIMFFIVGFKVDNLAGKIIFVGTAVVLLLATLLFSLVTMTQVLGGFSTIIEGYTTFWFVVKIIFSVALTALVVFALWYSYQAFMIKRGFRD